MQNKSDSVQQVVPLELLSAGEQGQIAQIDGDRDLIHRLAEMGFSPGCQVRMVQPGSPCIIALENHRLSFRGDDAAAVFVYPQTNGHASA